MYPDLPQATKQHIRDEVIQEERGISGSSGRGDSSSGSGGRVWVGGGAGGVSVGGGTKGVDDRGLSSPRPLPHSLALPPPLTCQEEKNLLHRLTVVDRQKHEETMRLLHKQADEEEDRVRQEGKELRTNPKSLHIGTRHPLILPLIHPLMHPF